MPKLYQYTILKQDGTSKVLPVSPKKDSKELYKLLNCTTIEIIPSSYYSGLNWGRCIVFGDEEGRYNRLNERNPHFNVIQDIFGAPWDVVGDCIREEVYKGEKI